MSLGKVEMGSLCKVNERAKKHISTVEMRGAARVKNIEESATDPFVGTEYELLRSRIETLNYELERIIGVLEDKLRDVINPNVFSGKEDGGDDDLCVDEVKAPLISFFKRMEENYSKNIEMITLLTQKVVL